MPRSRSMFDRKDAEPDLEFHRYTEEDLEDLVDKDHPLYEAEDEDEYKGLKREAFGAGADDKEYPEASPEEVEEFRREHPEDEGLFEEEPAEEEGEEEPAEAPRRLRNKDDGSTVRRFTFDKQNGRPAEEEEPRRRTFSYPSMEE